MWKSSIGQVTSQEREAVPSSPGSPLTFLLPSRFHAAVAHLFQRCALLLCLLLPIPHLRHPHHHHSAGALQKPELQQELRGQERGAPAVDQGAAPQLLSDLPGAPSAQHSSWSHRLREATPSGCCPWQGRVRGAPWAFPHCFMLCDWTGDGTRTLRFPCRNQSDLECVGRSQSQR